MAATSWNGKQPRISSKDGQIPRIVMIPEGGSTQTFKAGTPVKLSSNQVVIATDGTVGFVGIALADASGTQTTPVPVMLADPDQVYVYARITNNGTDTLATASAPAVGGGYGWYADADSVFYADLNDVGINQLIYEAPVLDANGDYTYWGRFVVNKGQAGNFDEEGA
jgi:hypothetical protein